MISETTVQRVRELDIADVVKPYTELRRHGSEFFGLCPFHSERTASFSVSPAKNLCYCHSCRKGGDGIQFTMEKEGLDFYGAVEFLARNHNITIEYTRTEQNEEQLQAAKKREALFAVLSAAHQFFTSQLRLQMDDEARAARDYTYSRWNEEFCDTSGIGYAPKDSRAFIDYCKSRALPEDLLFQSGLLRRSEDGRAYALSLIHI